MRYVPEYGARPVKRVVNDLFVNDLTMKLLEKELDKKRNFSNFRWRITTL